MADGSASLEPVITSSTSTVATDGTPAAVEKFCTDTIEMPTPEEPAVYVLIDSEHSVAIKGTVQAPVSNVAQPHDVLHVRGLSHGTVANAITTAIDVLKFRRAHSEDPFAPCDSIAKLKNRRNKEQTLAERERRMAIEDSNASILWEQ
ncbi:hypothetical protein HK104_010669, partial [Borealophlyctis nickersoniae]